MPAKSKKRRSEGQVYRSTPNLKQLDFPAPRRTIKDRTPSCSAPSKYQQTITQMNPFFKMYHPDAENEDLDYYDEEQESYVASPVGRKRRKITPKNAPARKIETRSARKQAIKAEQQNEKADRSRRPEFPQRQALVESSKPQSLAALMAPPKTPHSRRKKEIPSSQSPFDTPLSTRSRRSIREYSQSPLKERSTNIMLPPSSQKRAPYWTKKLEVADSMETVENDSPILSRVSSMVSLTSRTARPEEIEDTAEGSPQLPNVPVAGIINTKEIPESSQRLDQDESIKDHGQVDKEILNSDEEDDDGNEEFDAGLETQATLASVDLSLPDSIQRHAFGLFPSDLIEFEPERIETPVSSPNEPAKELHTGDQAKVHFPEIVEADDANHVAALDRTSRLRSQQQHFDTDGASAQLHNDLRRATQAGGLETESQFEGAWTSYDPAKVIDLESDPLIMLSSPEPERADRPPSTPTTVPTQLLPFRASMSTPFTLPIPPSQATTVDITQPSPRNMPSSSHALTSQRKMPSSSQAFPSSPPLAPPTSSPITARKGADAWAQGFEWNGVRLTDSQLLPESLMEDSQLGPPLILTQESLGDEL